MSDFDYEKSIWGRDTASLRWSDPTRCRLRQSLEIIEDQPDAKVLEVGCGAGQFIRAVKKIKPRVSAYGEDISAQAIEIGRHFNDGVDYSQSQENSLPFDDGYFDIVLIYDVLEHVRQPDKILAEVSRVLKKDGLFYCFVPCEGDWTSLWNCLDKLGLKKDLTKKYAGHINHFSRRQVISMAKDKNLAVVKKRYSEHFLGQLLGVAAFIFMDRYAKKNQLENLNNEAYFSGGKKRKSWFSKPVNFLVNLESTVFSRLISPNAHFVFKKNV